MTKETYVVCKIRKKYFRGTGKISRFFPVGFKWVRDGFFIKDYNARLSGSFDSYFSLTDSVDAAYKFLSKESAVRGGRHRGFEFQVLPLSALTSITPLSEEIAKLLENPEPETAAIYAQDQEEKVAKEKRKREQSEKEQEQLKKTREERESAEREKNLAEANAFFSRLQQQNKVTYIIVRKGGSNKPPAAFGPYLLTPWSSSPEWTSEPAEAFQFDSGEDANEKAKMIPSSPYESAIEYIVLPSDLIAEARIKRFQR